MKVDVESGTDSSPAANPLEDSVHVSNLIPIEARGFYQVFNIRVFARELTEAERYYNYKIDETRF